VRCQHIDSEINKGLRLEQRLASLENQFNALRNELHGKVDALGNGLHDKVDVRFREIEALLRTALQMERPKKNNEE
jgi:hypothetical protein